MKANRSITPHFKELKVKDYNWDKHEIFRHRKLEHLFMLKMYNFQFYNSNLIFRVF